MSKSHKKSTVIDNNNGVVIDYKPIAALALKDDASELANKGRGRVRTLAALYAANTTSTLANLSLHSVAMIESRLEKGEAYKTVFASVFDGSESAKMTNTFKNKLKISLDVLAYVNRMEAKHGVALLRVNETGDIIRASETLLDPAVSPKDANWYSTDGKKHRTSVDELARAARKHMLDETGEALPQPAKNGDEHGSRAGRKGKNEGDKTATSLHGVSLVEALDLISGQIQVAQAKADNKLAPELKEALRCVQAVILDALVADGEARDTKAKKKAA